MSTPDAPASSPQDGRMALLRALLQEAFDNMPPDLIAECRTLEELDPSMRGIRCEESDGWFHFTWVGRHMLSVPAADFADGAA